MSNVENPKQRETVQSVLEKIQDKVTSRLRNVLLLEGNERVFPSELILVALKEERLLQVYGKGRDGIKFIKEYPFTAYSGLLGPKLKEGDKQIPEGIYGVEYLNPNSAFYLSIKLTYPNTFDKSKTKCSDFKKMGGDIFIHGKSSTIGCIPIGDIAIEDIFVLVSKASLDKIKIIVTPRDFRTHSTYPQISFIDWEEELYDIIKNELDVLPNKYQ